MTSDYDRGDRLEEMMTTQLELQRESYGIEPSGLHGEDRADYIRTMALAAIAEILEAIDETSWKTWTSDQGAILNREAYIVEIVDAWHFLMNLLQVVNCSPDEFFNVYLAKAAKNKRRQAEGYAARTRKCSVCLRGLDDDGAMCTTKKCGYEDE